MTEKKTKNPFPFKTEVVTGECDHCKLTTLLVGIDGTFFRCISCGEDLEQKVNGVIKYIRVDKKKYDRKKIKKPISIQD